MMGRAAALMVLRAATGIHAGVGQELGIVDLPIQRERVTNFPVIRGSSLKGALSQAVRERWQSAGEDRWEDSPQRALHESMFGPQDVDGAPEYGGALSIGDARLLLFPMRSLRGTFAWLTCPFALRRLRRDLADARLGAGDDLAAIPRLDDRDQVAVCHGSRVLYQKPQAKDQWAVVVEDYGLDVASRDLDPVARAIARLLPDPDGELNERLVLVSDEHFRNFVSFCTEVVTRNKLDHDTKTVDGGGLWTEELLPAESVLTALVVSADERKGRRERKGLDMLTKLGEATRGRLQVGGHETVGYGVCHAHWIDPVSLDVVPGSGG